MLKKVKQMRADKDALARKRKESKAISDWQDAILTRLDSILKILRGVDQDDK